MAMSDTNIPYLDKVWSPCGWGCSKGCRTCWARGFARQRLASKPGGCPDCSAFRPHFHPERLDDPARRRKPAVIGVDFYADLFDPMRPEDQISAVLDEAKLMMGRTFVFLTERPARASAFRHVNNTGQLFPHWWFGATIRNQAQADATAELWARMPGNRWLSLEPMEGPVHADWNRIADFIVLGCDNDKSVPFDVEWVKSVVWNFQGKVYVKQLRIDGRFTKRLEDFPSSLRRRELPWTLTRRTKA